MMRPALLASLAALMLMTVPGHSADAQSLQSGAEGPRGGEAGPVLFVLSGVRTSGPGLAKALGDLALRDGGSFVDLRPVELAPPRAPLDLGRAVAAFQEFNYGKALEHLDAGIAEAEARGAEGLSRSELCDLFIYRAMVKAAQGDSAAAWEDYIRAVTIDPGRHLDAVRFRPSVVASFERAREQVATGPQTRLSVEAPEQCKLWVDGAETPARSPWSVPSGSHLLRVECDGYLPLVQSLPVTGESLVHSAAPSRPPSTTREQLWALARERGFEHLLWAKVDEDPGVPASTTLRLIAGPKELVGSSSLELRDDASDLGRAKVAIDRLLDELSPPPPLDIVETKTVVEKRMWYQSPWLWGSVGVVAASAILLPFALQDDAGAGFDVRLGGELP